MASRLVKKAISLNVPISVNKIVKKETVILLNVDEIQPKLFQLPYIPQLVLKLG